MGADARAALVGRLCSQGEQLVVAGEGEEWLRHFGEKAPQDACAGRSCASGSARGRAGEAHLGGADLPLLWRACQRGCSSSTRSRSSRRWL